MSPEPRQRPLAVGCDPPDSHLMLRLASLSLLLVLAGCASDADSPADSPAPGATSQTNAAESDAVAQATSRVTVAYKGTLPDGTVFDSSPGTSFRLNETISGFQTNIAGMTVGETKTFEVEPEDGYGDNPPPSIPPNTTLRFEVTLQGVQ